MISGWRLRELAVHALREFFHHYAWDAVSFGRINESKQNEVAQQHAPIRPKTGDQSRPIHILCPGSNEVRNIPSIKSFTLHDVGLLPDHFFHRTYPHRHTDEIH